MNLNEESTAIRNRDLIFAECIKMLTDPVVPYFVLITLVLNILLSAIDASGMTFYTGASSEPSSLSSFGVVMFAPIYAFLALPVYAAAGEYRDGQLRVSLVAVPARRRFILAKFVALLYIVVPLSLAVTLPGRFIIYFANNGGLMEFMQDEVCWTIAYVFMSVIAFGLAGIFKSSVVSLGILVSLPMVVATGVIQWNEGIRFLPDQASLSLLCMPAYDVTEISSATAIFTLSLWSALFVLIYVALFLRRDV